MKDAARQVVSSKSIVEYEDTLSKTAFFRMHNSYLINLSHILSIDKMEGLTPPFQMELYCPSQEGDMAK